MVIASLIQDYGQNIRIEIADTQEKYLFISKRDIIGTGRTGDYGYINLNEVQREVLRITQIKINETTQINSVSYSTTNDVVDALNLLLKFAPATDEAILTKPVVGLIETGTKILQYGDPATTLSVDYSVDKTTYYLDKVLLDGISIKSGSGSQSGTTDVLLVPDTDKRYTLEVEDIAGNISMAFIDVVWKWPVYYLASAYDNDEFESAISGGDVVSAGLDSELNDGNSFNTIFDCTGGLYIYALYPEAWGSTIDVYLGDLLTTDYTLYSVRVDDEFGIERMMSLVAINTIQTDSSINFRIVWQ